MIICHSRKFIFVHIHKTGGTSIERALDPHLAWNDLILGGSRLGEAIQGAYNQRYGLNKHSTIAEIEAVCGDSYLDAYFTFALVRHPVARMCSMYNFVGAILANWAEQNAISLEDIPQHITPKAKKKKPALKWASSRAFLASENFSEFIRHKSLLSAPGFRTQFDCLQGRSSGALRATFYRLEDIGSWNDELNRRLGLALELERTNESAGKLVDEQSVAASDRAFIEEKFQQDYEAFGYER